MQHLAKSKQFIAAALSILIVATNCTATAFAADRDDDSPPVLYSVAVSRSAAYPGDSLIVSADAEDDDSGVRSIKVQFGDTRSADVLTATLLTNSDEDTALPYSGVLKIPGGTSPGTYRITSVTLTDREGNQARYTRSGQEPLTEGMLASFSVVNASVGNLPKPVSCQAAWTGSGASIQFTASTGGVETDQVMLLFENGANLHKLRFTLGQEDYADGVYMSQFAVSPYEPAGTFTLIKVEIKDVAGNKTTYTTRDDEEKLPLNLSASFAVQSVYDDRTAPVLHAVTVGQPVREEDEAKALLTVRASDDLSGIEHVTVKFVHVGTGGKVSKVLQASDSGDGQSFTGYLRLDEGDARGTYQLDSVTVVDRSGNRMTYCHPEDISDRKLPLPQIPTFQF